MIALFMLLWVLIVPIGILLAALVIMVGTIWHLLKEPFKC